MKVNPADIATRERSVLKLPDNVLWWYGPSILNDDVPEKSISTSNIDVSVDETLT